jgi:hypothetical protein
VLSLKLMNSNCISIELNLVPCPETLIYKVPNYYLINIFRKILPVLHKHISNSHWSSSLQLFVDKKENNNTALTVAQRGNVRKSSGISNPFQTFLSKHDYIQPKLFHSSPVIILYTNYINNPPVTITKEVSNNQFWRLGIEILNSQLQPEEL